MKNIKHFYRLILFSALICACGEYKLEEELDNEEGSKDVPHTVQVITRSESNAQINYPLSLFLFDEKGKCIQEETIPDESASYSNNLPEGKYNLVLLSGISEDEYVIPFDFNPESFICFKEDNFAHNPIQIASAQINLTQSTTVQMTLSYAVSSINFIINDVPDEASQVNINLSPVSSGISFTGNYNNDNQSCLIPCTRKGEQWISETAYILPSESSSTRMSIQIELPDDNKAYGYTYQSALKPGYPYQFTGNYKDGITLNGVFQTEGWHTAVDVEFGISETIPDNPEEEEPDTGKDEEPDPISPTGTDSYQVTELPEEEDVWRDFYVWDMKTISETEYEAIIISPEQWEILAAEGEAFLTDYEISGIGGWRVFTKEEAKDFRSQYSYSLYDLNQFLQENGQAAFLANEDDRYLCNECLHSFAFGSSTISPVGEKRTYYLRPVKTIRLELK